jgi:hypothetical protein
MSVRGGAIEIKPLLGLVVGLLGIPLFVMLSTGIALLVSDTPLEGHIPMRSAFHILLIFGVMAVIMSLTFMHDIEDNPRERSFGAGFISTFFLSGVYALSIGEHSILTGYGVFIWS